MIVMKFGGTSVADAERIRAAAEIVERRIERGPIVVVSALAGVTDLLEDALAAATCDDLERLDPLLADIERRHRWALAGCLDDAGRRHHLGLEMGRLFEQLRQQLRSVRILGEGTPSVRDAVLAYGETLSSRTVAEAFREWGLPARWIDPAEVMATDDRFGAATPDLQRIREQCRTSLLPTVCSGELPVLGGFVGAGPSGKVTTLGRGGSDTTAAVLGLALEAEEVQIWTDVDGLMSADPRLVPSARTLSRVSFAEAAELSLYGARVLHPDAIAPAVRRSIPVRVLNSLRPEGEGTLVVGDRTEQDVDEAIAVASREGISLARLLSRRLPMEPGLPRQALAVCAEAGIAPQLVLSSAATVGLVAERSPALQALQRLDSLAEVTIEEDCAIACVVGAAVTRVPQLRERIMAELAAAAPELIATDSQGASIVAVVREAALASTVRRLHEAFVERGATR